MGNESCQLTSPTRLTRNIHVVLLTIIVSSLLLIIKQRKAFSMNISKLKTSILCISAIASFASTQVMSMDLAATKKRSIRQTTEQPTKKAKLTHNPMQQEVIQRPRATTYSQMPIPAPGFTKQPKTYMSVDGNYYSEQTYSGQEHIDSIKQTNKNLEEQIHQQKQQLSDNQVNQQPQKRFQFELQPSWQPRIATAAYEIDPAADRRLFVRYSNYVAEQQRLNS